MDKPASQPPSRWVYYIVTHNHTHNLYVRSLLTAADIGQAQKEALEFLGDGWLMHHGRMVCSTTDAPFFIEL